MEGESSRESGESTLEEEDANLRPFCFLLSLMEGESSTESGESGESTLLEVDHDANLRPFCFLLSLMEVESSGESMELSMEEEVE
jgi:hypothetical protein